LAIPRRAGFGIRGEEIVMKLLRFGQEKLSDSRPIVERDGSALRIVEPRPEPHAMQRAWTPTFVPAAPAEAPKPPISVKAEIRAKRLGAWNVEDDRYAATVTADDSSPAAIIAALAKACAGITDFQRVGADGDQLILQISLHS
jgi:hypothetical protein